MSGERTPHTSSGADTEPAMPCPWWSDSLGECRDSVSCDLPPRCVNGTVATDAGTYQMMQEMAEGELS